MLRTVLPMFFKLMIIITPLKQPYCISMIISPMPSDHGSCYVFAFFVLIDTIDHNILTIRLSCWFGIYGSVLNWFKSYLSSVLSQSNAI